MQVRRLKAYANNLVILYNEGIDDSAVPDHVRLIEEYITWFDSIHGEVSGPELVTLDTSRANLDAADPYFQAALIAMGAGDNGLGSLSGN